MKKLLLITASLLISATALAHDDPKISMAKIAELSAHRVDRLVALNKIDATFLKKLEKIEVIRVAGPAPDLLGRQHQSACADLDPGD